MSKATEGLGKVAAPVVYTCDSCGAALAQYQHVCNCGAFHKESFDADDRPPECEFFENDKHCGDDSAWFVFTASTIRAMCDRHNNDVVKNSRIEVSVHSIEDGFTCSCCNQVFDTAEEAGNCCAPTEQSLHVRRDDDSPETVCGLSIAEVKHWELQKNWLAYEQSENFDPSPYCHRCIGEDHA